MVTRGYYINYINNNNNHGPYIRQALNWIYDMIALASLTDVQTSHAFEPKKKNPLTH